MKSLTQQLENKSAGRWQEGVSINTQLNNPKYWVLAGKGFRHRGLICCGTEECVDIQVEDYSTSTLRNNLLFHLGMTNMIPKMTIMHSFEIRCKECGTTSCKQPSIEEAIAMWDKVITGRRVMDAL